MDEERRLMGRVAKGDEAAFTELVGRYGGRLLGVARRLLGSHADAEDAVQRALLQLYLGAGTYRAEWAVSTWLYRILTNVCVDELRRRQSRRAELEPPARPDPPGSISICGAPSAACPRKRACSSPFATWTGSPMESWRASAASRSTL